MDKFEKMMQLMSQMTEEERMKMIEANKSLCICPDCPTYNECAQEKGELFTVPWVKVQHASPKNWVVYARPVR